MIVVKIEMWPRGDESRKRDLAAIAITNVGGDMDTGNYEYLVSHQIDSPYGKTWSGFADFAHHAKCVWKRGAVTGFKRELGVVRLLQRVMKELR